MAVGMVMMINSVVSLFLNSALASSIRAWQISTELSKLMSNVFCWQQRRRHRRLNICSDGETTKLPPLLHCLASMVKQQQRMQR